MRSGHGHLGRFLPLTLAVCGSLALAPVGAAAATAKVDRSFGVHGVARPGFGPTYHQRAFVSIEPQADGTILAGRSDGGEAQERFHRFGPAGQLNVGPVPESRQPQPEVELPDGKVLRASGESLQRLEADGTPDPSFGTPPTSGGAPRSDYVGFRIEQIAVEDSGSIVVAGTRFHSVLEGAPAEPVLVPEQLCAALLDSSGRLSPGFGQGGVVRLRSELGFAGERLIGLAPRPGGGTVVVAGDRLTPPVITPFSAPGSYLVGLNAAGGLDPGYDGGVVGLGVAVTEVEPMPDGSLLLAGDAWSAGTLARKVHGSDLFLARFGDDGRPSPGFAAAAGVTSVDFGGIDLTRALLVEEDGSIVLGGSSTLPTSNCIYFAGFCGETPVLARFTPAGFPDPSFGSGGRLALAALSQPYVEIEGRGVEALAERPGGGLLAGGGSGPLAFLAAVSPSGQLDPSFGSGGVAGEAEPAASRAGAHSIAVDRAGRILLGGGTDAGLSAGNPEGAVFRLTPDGQLDPSFGGGTGLARVPLQATAIAAAGNAVLVLSHFGTTISRLTPAGTLDPGFGREGTVEPRIARANLLALAALPGGGAIAAGYKFGSDAAAIVVRLSPDGERERAFGKNGVATLPFGFRRRGVAQAIAVQRDGRVLVAGYVEAKRHGRSEQRLAVVRLLADGAVDRGFGENGIVSLRLGRKSSGSAIAVQRNGEILIAGRAQTSSGFQELLIRLTGEGRFEPGFGKGGVSFSQAPVDPKHPGSVGGAEPKLIVVRPGRYLVTRSGPGLPLIAYRRDGRLEPGFARGVVPPQSRTLGQVAAAARRGELVLVRSVNRVSSFQVRRLLLP